MGCGFVSFASRYSAEMAIQQMAGVMIGKKIGNTHLMNLFQVDSQFAYHGAIPNILPTLGPLLIITQQYTIHKHILFLYLIVRFLYLFLISHSFIHIIISCINSLYIHHHQYHPLHLDSKHFRIPSIKIRVVEGVAIVVETKNQITPMKILE
jgi:hypothetical protein